MRQTLPQVVGAIAVITLGAMTGMVEAQGPPPDPARRAELLKRFDADGDGILSSEELEAARTARNGRNSKSSEGSGNPSHMAPAARMSAAGNDQVIERLLLRFDRDGNGALNFAEMDALRTFMKTRSSQDSDAEVVAPTSPEEASRDPHHSPATPGGQRP